MRAVLAGMLFLLMLISTISVLAAYVMAGKNRIHVTAPLLGSRPYFSWGDIGDFPDTNELRKTVNFYLTNMEFSPPAILKHLNGSEAIPVYYNVEYERLYCVIPRPRYVGPDDFTLLTENPEYVERAKRENDRLVLGDYEWKDTESVFFSFPIEDLRIDPEAVINVPYSSVTYRLSLAELVSFHFNRNVYGSFHVTQCRANPEHMAQGPLQFPAFVVYPGEPSLRMLTSDLAQDETSIEKRAQRFLNFVTREIRPDKDLVKPCDKIKKVNEILMTGSCGLQESVILYASLLEQTDIDFLIVYTDQAAGVLVEGNYPIQRKALVVEINGKTYHLADPAQRGFQIGQPAGPAWQAENVRFIQRTGINSQTFSVETGKPSV